MSLTTAREVGEFLRVRLVSPNQEGFEGCAVRLVGQPVPKLRREVRDAAPAVGRPQDPAQRRELLRFQVGRGHPIGRNHEVLDQLLGAVFSIQLQTREDVPVENRFRLDCLKAERAVLVPQLHQPCATRS